MRLVARMVEFSPADLKAMRFRLSLFVPINRIDEIEKGRTACYRVVPSSNCTRGRMPLLLATCNVAEYKIVIQKIIEEAANSITDT